MAIGAPGSTSTSCAAMAGTAATGGGSTFVSDDGGTTATGVLSRDRAGRGRPASVAPPPAPGEPGATAYTNFKRAAGRASVAATREDRAAT
jgi:hypothetical protein